MVRVESIDRRQIKIILWSTPCRSETLYQSNIPSTVLCCFVFNYFIQNKYRDTSVEICVYSVGMQQQHQMLSIGSHQAHARILLKTHRENVYQRLIFFSNNCAWVWCWKTTSATAKTNDLDHSHTYTHEHTHTNTHIHTHTLRHWHDLVQKNKNKNHTHTHTQQLFHNPRAYRIVSGVLCESPTFIENRHNSCANG